ncbi:hypothetical protein ES703_117264 [subsurface metagenome]
MAEAPIYDARFDLDNNGVIDDADVEIFKSHYGKHGAELEADPEAKACDFNGSGTVDITDWTSLALHYGAVREEIEEPIPTGLLIVPALAVAFLFMIVILKSD